MMFAPMNCFLPLSIAAVFQIGQKFSVIVRASNVFRRGVSLAVFQMGNFADVTIIVGCKAYE